MDHPYPPASTELGQSNRIEIESQTSKQVRGWFPTPSLTALNAAIEVNGLSCAGADQVVADSGKIAVEARVGERVGEAVSAGETEVGRVGEAAVGVECGNTFTAVSLPSAAARRCAGHASSATRFSSAQSCL